MYVAVKGGETAIANAHQLLADRRRGNRDLPAITIEQIAEQLALSVDRVMAEASLYDRSLAALAVKQSRGDLIEAIFLLRAYRTTLPRFGTSEPINTARMQIERRVSATYKDLPGGQLWGQLLTIRTVCWTLICFTIRPLKRPLAGPTRMSRSCVSVKFWRRRSDRSGWRASIRAHRR